MVDADTLSPDGIQARLEELQKELIKKANNKQDYDAIADEILADIHSSEPVKEGQKVYYPGERSMETRRENLKNGIPVLDEVWEKLESLEPKQA